MILIRYYYGEFHHDHKYKTSNPVDIGGYKDVGISRVQEYSDGNDNGYKYYDGSHGLSIKWRTRSTKVACF